MIQTITLKPQRRAKEGGPATAPLRDCGAANQDLRTVLAWSRNRDRAPGRLAPMPLDVADARTSVRKRPHRLQQLLPDEKVVMIDQSGDRIPLTNELTAVQSQLQQLTAQQVASEDRGRVQAWRDSMDKACKDERREVYKWVKGKEDPPLVMLARKDGTLTAKVGQMDALVRQA